MDLNVTEIGNGVAIYRTIEGDMIDQIAHARYGKHQGTTELLYEANPHVLEMPFKLPANVEITLPAIVVEERVTQTIRLWD